MFRIVLRNLLIALGVALPTLITCAAIVGWLLPPAWAGGARPEVSVTGFLDGFAFWYIVLALPTLALAFLHQVALAALPHDWPARRERLVLVGSSIGVGALVAAYIVATSSDVRAVGLVASLLPASLAYGVLIRPIRGAG